MDFAKKQLEKYGWREGKGLGKNEDGISTAIKPKLKFDNSGVGHQQGKEFTNNWWEKLYTSALDNVEVKSKEGKIKVKTKSDDAVEITTKSYSVKDFKKNNKTLEYGTFLKTSKLTDSGITDLPKPKESFEVPETSIPKIKVLSDEELFAACGGRTAHKGARHGLQLSGKLSRIEKQERMLLKKLKSVSITDDKDSLEKKIKKLSKNRDKSGTKDIEDNIHLLSLDDYDSRSSGSVTPKKKFKKRRSVTFNDTVTSYTIHDIKTDDKPDIESDRGEFAVVEMVKIREGNAAKEKKDEDGADEGIEQDCDTNNTEDNTSHKSFEEAQVNEEERLKKYRKSKKRDTATKRFLSELRAETQKTEETQTAHVKRKIFMTENEDYREVSEYKKIKIDGHRKSGKDSKKKRRKQKKKQEKREINFIVQSLDEKCKISSVE